jgi:23S rRNA (cytidine1920-2'-O)/16S rRNA (cytidine1409-2'-O)-methyltransferase
MLLCTTGRSESCSEQSSLCVTLRTQRSPGRGPRAREGFADTVLRVAPKQRLDTLLAERGLFPSRSRAAASVMAGEVCVGEGRRRAQKPGEMVAVDALLSVQEQPRYVSRGGLKLANALAHTGLSVRGAKALDVGASTGGFSDCLLQHGAAEVVAVDVGYGELHWGLRTDPRVHVLERTNARALTPTMLPYAPAVAVVDVSFIALAKVLAPLLGCMAARFDVLALIKPQFEVGRGRVGKGGVVRDAGLRREALEGVGCAAWEWGAAVLGFCSSGLPGPKGNRESFIWLAEGTREGAAAGVAQVRAMALAVEP